ncbi:ASCH domain-containing protein [Comamonas sp.]|uniref:ASCH domain-containing protein n=1 Tax=Comamonas sp. TaxID=34028 RepID=UPI002FC6199C
MRTLYLPLKREYFEAIRDETKVEEYRLCTPHWRKRLEAQQFDQVVLTLGYPARDDQARRITLPWRGHTVKTITHPHFGPEPVEVFAIDVKGQP